MTVVSYETDRHIAVITVDNAPVNALSHAVRQGLSDAFARFEKDENARIAVLVGAGKLFLGGADISEFGKPSQDPILPDVINQIEASSKPVVAGLHGAALGGGLEVALGAHYRIAVADTKLGLPEVKLGLLPGAGGTQRLPRLVPLDIAIGMITGGAPMSAQQAGEVGLVDAVTIRRDIQDTACEYAQQLLDQNAPVRPLSGQKVHDGSDQIALWRDRLTKSTRGEVAPLAALSAVEDALRLPFSEGLAQERSLFQQLIDTPQRAGMIHAFFAERAVAKLPEIKGVSPRDLTHIGVVGGGTMGAGIATASVLAGLRVTLVERDIAAAEKAQATILRNLQSAIKRGKLDQARYDDILANRLKTVTDYGALHNADLAIEAVFEDMTIKKSVFRELDRVMPQSAILATNTSYLDVNEIAQATSRPRDVIGLHFFSPAHIMKLLEVVVADQTASDVVATAFSLAKLLGKTAVRAGVCDGFIGNRILSHYRTAADHMVLDGASPYQIDKALTDFGFAMGPYQVSDLAGIDIGYATRQRKLANAHPRDRQPTFADALFHLGRLGQKTGRGYYLYDADTPKGRPDPDFENIISQARTDAAITPRAFSDAEIVRRYTAAMVNEGARVFAEGIAQRPSDIDVVFLFGYGFPRWRGGPMKYADMHGLREILSDINSFADEDDHFWTPAPLLKQLVDDGRNFDSLNKA